MRSTAKARTGCDRCVNRHFRVHVLQYLANLAQGDALHVWAKIARTHELNVRMLEGKVVAHRTLGHEDDSSGLIVGN
jgi:hypothetical protein